MSKSPEISRGSFFFFFVSVRACECVFAKLSSSQVLIHHLSGLMQERLNSIANALELRLSCINLSIYQQLSCALFVVEREIFFHPHNFFPWWTKHLISLQVEIRAWLLQALMMHICVSELGQHCFRQWLVACSAPSHHLNQCWLIINWTPRNKVQWNLNWNSNIFIQGNGYENKWNKLNHQSQQIDCLS